VSDQLQFVETLLSDKLKFLGLNLRKYFHYFLDCPRQYINLFLSIIESKRRSRCGGNIEALHNGLGAVMAGANGYALLIEDRSNVMWMNVVNHKRKHAGLLPRGSDNPYTFDCRQALSGVSQQFVLVRCRFRSINRIQVVNRSPQTNL
jgi:hypothetical protein